MTSTFAFYIYLDGTQYDLLFYTHPSHQFLLPDDGKHLLLQYRLQPEPVLAGAIADWLEENRSLLLSTCRLADGDDKLTRMIAHMRNQCLSSDH